MEECAVQPVFSTPLLEPQESDGVVGTPSGRLHRVKSPMLSWTHPFAANSESELDGFNLSPPKMGTAAIFAMAFFNVSGGPWGSEDIFSSSCPAVGCLGIVVFTIFFCVPQVLVTSELSCALPSNGGYLVWIQQAFGDLWASNVTYWQWVSGVADAAVYPVLICDTLLQLLGLIDLSKLQVWVLRVLTTIVLSMPTFVSFSSVPSLMVAMAITTGLPVITFVALGAGKVNPSVWLETRGDQSMRLGKMVNVLFWNMEGWDCVSTCSALCEDPIEKTMPRGLFAALGVTCLQYLVVLAVAAGISEDTAPWQSWTDGTLPSIGRSLGMGMTGLLLVSSLVGNAGQYLSEFLEDSFLLQGAAETGIGPRCLGMVSKSGAPIMSNLTQLAIVMLVLTFDFSDILVFDNFFCASAITLEFLAFIKLRWSQPDLRRPFRMHWAAFALLPPAAVILAMVLVHCLTKSANAFAINVVAFAVGLPYGWWVARKSKREHEEGHRSGFDKLLEDS